MHWRLGYHRVLSLGKRSQGFGHMGFNGSGAWCDPDRQLSFAYTHNFAAGSLVVIYRLWGLSQEAIRCADRQLQGRKRLVLGVIVRSLFAKKQYVDL